MVFQSSVVSADPEDCYSGMYPTQSHNIVQCIIKIGDIDSYSFNTSCMHACVTSSRVIALALRQSVDSQMSTFSKAG